MKDKDIKLFSKAIHNAKKVIQDIETERQKAHEKLNKSIHTIKQVRNSHDKKMKKLTEEVKEILDEVYELFEDLYEEKTGE